VQLTPMKPAIVDEPAEESGRSEAPNRRIGTPTWKDEKYPTRLREARDRYGHTSPAAAGLLEVSPQTYRKWEREAESGTAPHAKSLPKVLKYIDDAPPAMPFVSVPVKSSPDPK
jgi:DNA-binding XRE family transcriptional regulator